MKKNLNEGNLIHNFKSSSGSGTVISSGSDFLTSSGSTSQKVTVLTVPVPQHCENGILEKGRQLNTYSVVDPHHLKADPDRTHDLDSDPDFYLMRTRSLIII
jgi:hypothetical protein